MKKLIMILFTLAVVLVLVSIQAPPAQAQTKVTIVLAYEFTVQEYDACTVLARAQKGQPVEDPDTGQEVRTPLFRTCEEMVEALTSPAVQQVKERISMKEKPADIAALEKQMRDIQDQLAKKKKVPVTVTKQ